MKRKIETETNIVVTGAVAASSYEAPFFNLISPFTIRRLAWRKTVGAKKYGSVQWRQGINDAEYTRDRFNHFIEHVLNFMSSGNKFDDNIGAMLWALDALSEIERLAPGHGRTTHNPLPVAGLHRNTSHDDIEIRDASSA